MYKPFIALIFSTKLVFAEPPVRDYVYDVDVISVYDGDTLNVDIDLGFSIWIKDKSLRLLGIDAPEVKGATREQGLVVRDWLRSKVKQGKNIIIQTFKDESDKYGRYLAVLYIDGVNINQLMLDEGLVRSYNP